MRDLIINSNPDKPKHRELLKPDVKKALELAIDRDEIVKTAWLGKAQSGTTIVTPVTQSDGVSWHNANVTSVGFDLDQANQLLDAAGYAKGSDGVRVADGAPMSYTVIFADDESGAGDRAFQIIKDGFAKIGVALTQKKLDSSASWEAIYCGEDCEYRDFDLAMCPRRGLPDRGSGALRTLDRRPVLARVGPGLARPTARDRAAPHPGQEEPDRRRRLDLARGVAALPDRVHRPDQRDRRGLPPLRRHP